MKHFSLLFSGFIITIMTSCSQKQNVDLIVTNATVYTIDEAFTKVESFAVNDGKIVETGSKEQILNKYSSEKIIRCKRQICLPWI